MTTPAISVEERVRAAISKELDIPYSSVTLGISFADLNVDSLEFLSLANVIEDEFDTHIPNDVLTKMEKVQDLVTWLQASSR